MCNHESFQCNASIGRLTDTEDSVIITGYSAHIKIHCTQCGQAFEFIGVEGGYSFCEPRVSIDSTELRIPIKPSTGKLIFESHHKLN